MGNNKLYLLQPSLTFKSARKSITTLMYLLIYLILIVKS